ncbi:hypothetical protein GCM10011321_06720 [Youhaiella tibetensis]|uniref:Uncharacterized protein n=1 Tax=Paradevosia tibetensis TaxID=1447062 RepID=A0A5B9DPQ1_9HYPH|nr:hypothetical protein [Youhaiella tibetensis]QEE21143.1 hypothetical protein FNA67_13590 [Youhaiella tibetensis]GGF17583.1 hypothetical protein GCM10011321_06720 [Youhaiella tibetensis]
MARNSWVMAIGVLAALFAPQLAAAQEAPEPRPRAEHDAAQARAAGETPPEAPADDAASALAEPGEVPGVPTETPATSAIEAVTQAPQPVHLKARVTDKGDIIPSGLVWRVFDTRADNNGQLAMVAKSDDADATLSLPPGQYVVHVAYGRAQASDTITVNPGENDKTMVLEAGALRLNSAVTGDIAIPVNLEHFDIFSGGTSDADRTLVAQNVAPNDTVTLNAGTYHVVSYFGDVNAVVRADLRVEPGQLTEATLYHRASQISLKLVSEAGGEAIADVDWTIKSSAGETVFQETGAFPATVLQEGDYTVLAKRGDTVYNRAFQVVPGQPREIEVLTSVY